MTIDASIKGAVLRVGDGRGFIVDAGEYRFVVTAAHCLPHLPPCTTAAHDIERTYRRLLGPLDEPQGRTWATCQFVDPVNDIAVLGCPDNQVFYKEARAYEELVDARPAFLVAEAPENSPAWLLTLDGNWASCTLIRVSSQAHVGRSALWIQNASAGIRGGMSGSPIVVDGAAVGIVTVAKMEGEENKRDSEGGPDPYLLDHLPAWLVRVVAPQ